MNSEVVDHPAEVAAIVAAESAWVPAWHRIVVQGVLTATPGLLVLGTVSPPGAASLAAVAAVTSRVVPSGAVRRLHRDSARATVRGVRQSLLTAYVGCGLIVVAALPRAMAAPWALVVGVLAVGLVVLQHRPASASARVTVVAEGAEALVLVALLPALAMATTRWWQ